MTNAKDPSVFVSSTIVAPIISEASSNDAKPIHVLIIDDDVTPGDALVRLLSLSGFQVTCAQTGADGLASAVTALPEVIVLDLHLPDVLGITVLSHLRNRASRTPIIAVTGWYSGTGHEECARALGATFLRKPFDADQLADALRRAVFTASMEIRTESKISSFGVSPRMRPPSSNDDALKTLHDRGIAGNGSAVGEIVERLEPVLRRSLASRLRAQPDWVHDAVQDALIDYMVRPNRLDCSRGVPLPGFLLMAAYRNLLNRIDAERRRGKHERAAQTGKPVARTPMLERGLDVRTSVGRAWTLFDVVEKSVFRAILRGERSSDALAKTANVEHLAPAERREVVRRLKNRLFQRLRRLRRQP
jgi:CheY-like chemotaxis protein